MWGACVAILMVDYMDNSRMKRFLLGMFGAAALLGCASALADLMLHPTRVVFENNRRTAQLEIINRGDRTEVYRISLARKRMTDTGEFVTVDAPMTGEQFADDFIRYSPRQIELAPGATQAVRLMLRKPADLAAGEYRSHLVFERIPDPEATSGAPSTGVGADLEIKLVPLVNVSVPLIVRHGETDATVSLIDLRLEPSTAGEPALLLTLRRDGNRSVYGDLVVYSTGNGKRGAQQIIARVGGVAVYAPNALRRARLVLSSVSRRSLAGSVLRVTYQERPENGGKVLAESSLAIP